MNLRERRIVVRNLQRPFEKFFNKISGGGILLMIASLLALIWANSDAQNYYDRIWSNDLAFSFEQFEIHHSLLYWINDGLMTLFFLLVGLEIKREFLAGELSSLKKAVFPFFAAAGGMLFPMILYLSFGLGGEQNQGWGIPMATDIAFSLAILSMLGKRVPLSIKVFLTALAIVDDLGALLVIALFYSHQIYWSYLLIAGLLLMILIVANYFDVQVITLYAIIGFFIWFLFLESGIHPTIAGVLIAFTVPARTKVHIRSFLPKINWRLKKFSNIPINNQSFVLSNEQLHAIDDIEELVNEVQSPLQKMEHRLSGLVNYLILPLFALSNAGVTLLTPDSPLSSVSQAFTTLSLAIALSLVLGKVTGITIFSWLAVKVRLAHKPRNVSWLTIVGLGLLGGIGFTMSLFIANLAFSSPELLDQAKVGIFAGSIAAGFGGYYLLKFSLNRDLYRPADQANKGKEKGKRGQSIR